MSHSIYQVIRTLIKSYPYQGYQLVPSQVKWYQSDKRQRQ